MDQRHTKPAMGLALVKTDKTKTMRQGRSWTLWSAVSLVVVVSVSVSASIGFGVGWSVQSSPAIASHQLTRSPLAATAPVPTPTAPASAPETTPTPVPETLAPKVSASTFVSKPMSLPAPKTKPPPGSLRSRPWFLLFGDSITEQGGSAGGWVAQLQQTYAPNVNVLNRGRSGSNTKILLDEVLPGVLRKLVSAPRPALIIVWIGANDATLANGPAVVQHVPIDQYKSNLRVILSQLHRFAPRAKILLMTPPVVDNDARREILVNDGKPSDPLDRSNHQAGAYAAACGEVAKAIATVSDRVALLDMHSSLMRTYPAAKERGALLGDGLHFNDQGSTVVHALVKQQIEALLPASMLHG